MEEKLLVFIILSIIFLDIYYLINKDNNITPVEKKISKIINDTEKSNLLKSQLKVNNNFSFIETKETPTKILPEDIEEDIIIKSNVSPNMFGKPSEHIENKYILWEFQKPVPWTKIIYKYNEKYPFYFFIKIKIPSLNDYEIWKNIIPYIDFDPKTGEIVIQTTDEESALSIANLIITNFKGEISIEEIMKKNLIDISINKSKKYDIVKNKIREQLISSLSTNIKESFKDVKNIDYETDLAINDFGSKKKNDDMLDAYEGNEYSFI